MITNLNRFTKNQILQEYNKYLASNEIDDNLENFSNYLLQKNWSTTHAEDVYNFIHSGNFTDLTNVEDIRLRKDHPKRDRFIKKGAIPAVLTGGAIWGILSLLAAAITAGQSSLLGTAILSDAAANSTNFIATAVGYSLAGFFGFIAIKNAATKKYYNKKYGADKTLKQLNSKKLEKTNLAELVNLINKDNERIYNLRDGKFITKPFRFIARHTLNIRNRNRMHQFAKTYEDLLDKYYTKINDTEPTDTDKFHDVELNNIVKTLEFLNSAYEADITTSKLFTLLSCKEEGKHKHTIESLDIWTKLSMLSEAMENANGLTKELKKEVKKDYSKIKKDQVVYEVARDKFNKNPNLLQRCTLERFYNLGAPVVEPAEFIFGEDEEVVEEIVEPIGLVFEDEVIEPVVEPITVITEEPTEDTIIEPVVEETPIIIEEDVEPVVEETEENLIKRSTQRLQAKVKVDELTRGNKVTITNLQDNSKETIKVTATPSGAKINVEVKKPDGTTLKNSFKNTNNEVDVEVKRILQETTLNSGVDLQQLNLI